MRNFVAFVFVLFLLSSFVSADRVCGFRGACLANHSDGLYFNASEYDFNLTIRVNDLNVPNGNLEDRIFYGRGNHSGFKWVHAVKLRRSWLVNGLVDNMSIIVIPVNGVPMEHTGTGELTFRRGVLNYDVVSFGDLVRTLNYFNLNAVEQFNGTHYRIVLRGFRPDTPLINEEGGWGWVVLDPTIDDYGFSNMTLGGFNNTYLNSSVSIQTLWYANNLSFGGFGTYYSRPLELNSTRGAFGWVNSVNWSWYEAMGFNVSVPGTTTLTPIYTNQSGSDGYIGQDLVGDPPTTTRYPDGTTSKIGSATGVLGENNWRAYLIFNTSAIPNGSTINSLNLSIYVETAASDSRCGINALNAFDRDYANTTNGNIDFFADLTNGTSYNYSTWCLTTGMINITLSAQALTDLQNAVSGRGLWGVGINSSENNVGFTNGVISNLETATPARVPKITVSYTPPSTTSNADSAVGSWHFENDSKDSSRYNNTMFRNATANSQPSFNQTCIIGGCYYFDGNDMLQKEVSGTTNISEAITATAWVQPFFNNTDNNYFISKASFGAFCGYGMALQAFNSTHRSLAVVLGNGTVISFLTASVFVPLNQWTHVGFTYNVTNNSVFFYRNGQRIALAQGPLNKIHNCDQNLVIGARFAENFYGSIDEVNLWNRSLSQSEVAQLYAWQSNRSLNGNEGFLHNYTNVSLAFRTKNYTFDDTNLLAWWDFGDSTDNETTQSNGAQQQTLDLSGNGRNLRKGALTGPAVLNTSCVIGKCLTLGQKGVSQGVGGFTAIASAPTMLNFTASLWFNPFTSPNVGHNLIAVNPDGLGSRWQLSYNTFQNLTFTITNASSVSKTIGFNETIQAKNGTWQHVVIVYDGTTNTSKFYYNGTQISSANVRFTQPSGAFTFLFSTNGNADFNGSIDDIKIWDRALNSTEITQLYNAGNPTNSTGQEKNWTNFGIEYNGGNANVVNTVGNLVQYRATFSTTSTNFSAFLKNVSVNYINTLVPLADNPPQWFYNQTTPTGSTCPSTNVTFAVNWTDDIGLADTSFYLDNGNGTFQLIQTLFYLSTLTAWHNETITVNSTVGSVIRGYWNATDTILQTNGTGITTITVSDCTIPQWSNPSANNTVVGGLTLFLTTWQDNFNLYSWIFEFDNGTDTFTNVSTGFFSGIQNVSNATRYINQTVNTTIRWRFWANDSSGNWNVTAIQSFQTIDSFRQAFVTCNDGSYIKNRFGQVYFYANATGITCQIRVLNTNLSQVVPYTVMTENSTELRWFNYSMNLTTAGKYWASFNCSNGYSASNDIAVVNSCTPTILLSTDANSNKMDATLFLVFLLIAVGLYVWGFKTRNAFLRMAAFAWLIAVAFLVFSGDAFQLPVTNSTIDTSSAVITTSTTTTLTDVKNSWTDNLALLLLVIAVLFAVFEGVNYWNAKSQVKLESE